MGARKRMSSDAVRRARAPKSLPELTAMRMSQLGLSVGLSCVFAVLIVVVLFGDVSPGEHGGTEVIHQEAGSAEMPAEPRLAEQMLAQDPLNAVVPEDAAW